jgi:endonuclease-3
VAVKRAPAKSATRRAPKAAPKWDAATKRRARTILARLTKAYPDWGPTLEFSTPLELLIATILAAQARDERINQVTRVLFRKYRTPQDWLGVPQATLEQEIRATGFFRQKARAIKGACQGIVEIFGGTVPSDMDSLTRLRGVGRKTASIVLGAAFGVPAIAVDRHVARVAERLRLAARGPDGTEKGLAALYPKKDWIRVTWTFVLHGRRTCMPTPACPRCPVIDLCPYPRKTKA